MRNKRWLAERKRSGLYRAMDVTPCIVNKYSGYVKSLPAEARDRYHKKLQYENGTKSLPDPYSIHSDWSDGPSTWPDLTFGDIFVYLIDTPSMYTRETMKAYKSLDAYQYVISGHVQTVMSHSISSESPYMALKTKVVPSQRSRDKPHEPWVYLSKATGSVYCAHCTCMAGLGEVCSHTAALLFKVEMGVKMGLSTTSSTSVACTWNATFRKEVNPATVVEICQQSNGTRNKVIESVQGTGSTPLPTEDLLKELYSLVPNAAFFTTISPIEDVVLSSEPVLDKFPLLLCDITCESDAAVDQKCTDFFKTYTVTSEQCYNLEKATRDQSVCSLWYQHRIGRITASKAHDVLTLKPSTVPDNLVKRIMGYNSYDLSKRDAVRWGLDHEDECRKLYTEHMSMSHQNFKCRHSGFIVSTDHPFLGASPDGVMSCDCCGTGTLEIKCPFKHRSVTVQKAAETDREFCLDSSLQLKTQHRYYTQVQFQMFVARVQFCDFVIFTKCSPPNMVIVRISQDGEFCKQLVSKCDEFAEKQLIRELFTRNLESQPSENITEDCNNNIRDTWCICSEPEYGRMIQCDNDECPYIWFHYKCVNIKRKPRGRWLCSSCSV